MRMTCVATQVEPRLQNVIRCHVPPRDVGTLIAADGSRWHVYGIMVAADSTLVWACPGESVSLFCDQITSPGPLEKTFNVYVIEPVLQPQMESSDD